MIEIILRLLSCFLSFLLFDVFMLFFGYLLFYIGKFFKIRILLIVGHIIFAYSSAPFFGFNKKWIYRNCPLRKCHNCCLWTCEAYGKNINSKD